MFARYRVVCPSTRCDSRTVTRSNRREIPRHLRSQDASGSIFQPATRTSRCPRAASHESLTKVRLTCRGTRPSRRPRQTISLCRFISISRCKTAVSEDDITGRKRVKTVSVRMTNRTRIEGTSKKHPGLDLLRDTCVPDRSTDGMIWTLKTFTSRGKNFNWKNVGIAKLRNSV